MFPRRLTAETPNHLVLLVIDLLDRGSCRSSRIRIVAFSYHGHRLHESTCLHQHTLYKLNLRPYSVVPRGTVDKVSTLSLRRRFNSASLSRMVGVRPIHFKFAEQRF